MEVKTYNYGNYSSDNYGSSRAVIIGRLQLFFSYQTVVAFSEGFDFDVVCSENIWGKTTGRHLNCIMPDHKARLPHAEFQEKLLKALEKYGFN